MVEINCVECGDQPAEVFCRQCEDNHCKVCFSFLHKAGKRKLHVAEPLLRTPTPKSQPDPLLRLETKQQNSSSSIGSCNSPSSCSGSSISPSSKSVQTLETGGPEWFCERAKFIPLRLTEEERELLELVEGALDVSEYTEMVDISSYNRHSTMVAQLEELLCTILGLKIASDYTAGLRATKGRSLKDNAQFFQRVFEVGRRHKIRNPDKMREGHGKMMYALMDSVDVEPQLGFSLIIPLETVYSSLQARNALEMLRDPLMSVATGEMLATSFSKEQLADTQREKQEAITALVNKFGKEGDADLALELRRCLLSFCDHNNFLVHNRAPCAQMISWLKTHFEQAGGLAIYYGRGGSRLTHSSSTQFGYVLESLVLWEHIQNNMYALWCLAEADLLDRSNPYRLIDTGQGMNRCQRAPRVGRAMSEILDQCAKLLGGWVGSSVVHLGDRDVPNALMFIDKYIQVPRILNPIVSSLQTLQAMCENDLFVSKFIDRAYGSAGSCCSTILADFFKHGFDGSGADNSYDAGSCIDGRLTSAWNWCSLLEKKPYFAVFLLAGFSGFDGQF